MSLERRATTARPDGPLHAVRTIAADIKLAHSVFALPFALLAAFMAARPDEAPIAWGSLAGKLALIVLAMFLARSFAMLANRWFDREIDARNPRTEGRALPSGRLAPATAIAALAGGAALFAAVCFAFGVLYANWWPLGLCLPVLAWIGAYALLKRHTVLCHLYLGSSLAISPLAAAVAIDPAAVPEQPALWLLAGTVLFWVAGFDVIYALQDVEVDRVEGLHSLPARLGERRAMAISRTMHALAAIALIAAIVVDARLATLFAAATTVVIALLVYEHLTVRRWGTTRVALAFFTLNGLISCLLGAAGIADVLVTTARS